MIAFITVHDHFPAHYYNSHQHDHLWAEKEEEISYDLVVEVDQRQICIIWNGNPANPFRFMFINILVRYLFSLGVGLYSY